MWRIQLSLSLLAATAAATTVERFDLAQLTERAERIFVGTCLTAANEVVDGYPYTRYEFRVSQIVKGDSRQSVEVVLPEGRDNGTSVHIPGMPRFVPGEEAVVFLTGVNATGHAWPVGLGQGKFCIERDAAAKQARVVQELQGLLVGQLGPAKPSAPDSAVSGMPLEDFLRRVQSLVGQQASGGHNAR